MFWIIAGGIVAAGVLITLIVLFIVWMNVSVRSGGKRIRLSRVSREIVKEFKDISPAQRPFPVETLYPSLIALDIKHDKEAVDRHFTKSGYEYSYFSWKCECWNNCVFSEYKEMHTAIAQLVQADKDRQHALDMAGIASSLDRVKELTESIRTETKIMREVTEELVS